MNAISHQREQEWVGKPRAPQGYLPQPFGGHLLTLAVPDPSLLSWGSHYDPEECVSEQVPFNVFGVKAIHVAKQKLLS